MSDELNALQETAVQARATANELNAAITDTSSDEERDAAKAAEQVALTAESAFADAKAKADVDAAAHGGDDAEKTTVKAGDTCTCPDGRTGTVHSYDEGLICIPNADQGN